MFEITFMFEEGSPVIAFANEGENLLELARKNNVAIDAPCSGNASCGKCRVKLVGGELNSEKTRHISEEEYAEGWRLSCVSKVAGNCQVLVPDIASAYRSRMKVADLSSGEEIAIFEETKQVIQNAGIEFTNNLKKVILQMDEPTLDDTLPDNERLINAIEAEMGPGNYRISYSALRKLSESLRAGGFQVQCIVDSLKGHNIIMDVIPAGEPAVIAGLAIDIGTTSVAALLVDMENGKILAKASTGNGQIRYGADVINRIIESTRPGGRDRLQKAILDETLKPLIRGLCREAKIPMDGIYRICIAGNTTMNHLLLGVHSDPIRMEPYIPTFFSTNSVTARDLGIRASSSAKVRIAPNVGSYVGGDITAGTLASGIWNRDEFSLFVDLGTNGELVFGSNEFLMTCACSAGPAFEGGDISCGMRATDGAIDSFRLDPETKEPIYTVIGDPGQKPVGLCGSGIIDVIAELFIHGIINAKGQIVVEGPRVHRNQYGIGSYVLAFKEDADSVKDVEITEVDIDNFIRAKGAIFSAINTMLTSVDFDPSMIDDVYVAGGIGSGINMKNAVLIGMFPDIPLEKFHYIGNSSLSGAYAILLSEQADEKVHELGRSMTYLELSTEPGYMDEFVGACFLPHTNSSLFPTTEEELAKYR